MADKQKYLADEKLISLLEEIPEDDTGRGFGFLYCFKVQNESHLVGITSLNQPITGGLQQAYQTARRYLPCGLEVGGFYVRSSQNEPENIISKCKKCLSSEDAEEIFPTSNILVLGLVSERPTLYSYNLMTSEMESLQVTVTEDSILDICMLGRLSCALSICLEYKPKQFKSDLSNEFEYLKEKLQTRTTVFHVSYSNILLFSNTSKAENLTCKELLKHIEKEDEDEFTRKAKQKNTDFGKMVIHFEMLSQSTGDVASEKSLSCTPVIRHSHASFQQLDVRLPLDVVIYLHPETKVNSLHEKLSESVCCQLDALYNCIIAHNKNDNLHTPIPYHFKPNRLSHLITTVYPEGLSEDDLVTSRKAIHDLFVLPKNIPFVRRQNLYIFNDEKISGGYLLNPHLNLSTASAKGRISAVQGLYSYHHYMQDRMDDNKWGCAYRSLQTLVSWFRFQGYTDKTVPTHREIQQALVDIGDKEAKFVGSKQWIGSTEVSFVLDHLFGVTSKILFVSNGADLSNKGRELSMHFDEQGTPIMIGGGVLAHTILGVDFNEITGNLRFLILDPHYTGGEDLKVILDKGWCGWKGPDFWDQHAYYNLCMPQRPNMI